MHKIILIKDNGSIIIFEADHNDFLIEVDGIEYHKCANINSIVIYKELKE